MANLPIRWLLVMWLLAIHASCLHEASQSCGDGSLCPPGQQCVDPGTAAANRVCVAGRCGNGRIDPGEACDDGNNHSGDGCPADCTAPCGDDVLDPDEVCDDGNVADGDGCAADCRSLDGLSLVSPPSVELVADEGGALPAELTVTVRPPMRGDLVALEDVPGTPRPTWLSVTTGTITPSSVAFVLGVTDTSVVGERAAIVRLAIRHRGAATETFDLPVTYRVAASDLAIHATPPDLAFTTTEGVADIASQTIELLANGDDVALISAPPWLTVTGPAAPSSPVAFVVAVDDPSPVAWTTRSGDAVFATRRGAVERRTSVHVEYEVLPQPPLAISAVPDELAFTAVAGADVPPAQTVNVTATGSSVELISAPAWLTVTAHGAAFTVAVNTTAFAAGTVQHGQIQLGTTRDGAQETTTVDVTYTLRYPPELLFVAPYVGVAGRGGSVYLRGRGLQIGRPLTIRIGESIYGPVTPDNDTMVTLSYPALPAGRYPVALVDPAVVSPRAPELVVVASPAFAYAVIDAPGAPNRLLYDAERHLTSLNQGLSRLKLSQLQEAGLM